MMTVAHAVYRGQATYEAAKLFAQGGERRKGRKPTRRELTVARFAHLAEQVRRDEAAVERGERQSKLAAARLRSEEKRQARAGEFAGMSKAQALDMILAELSGRAPVALKIAA